MSGLLEVGVAGEDELLNADHLIVSNALGHLFVAADQGGAGASANQTDSGPQVRSHHQLVPRAAVQGVHALLADRFERPQSLLAGGDRRVLQSGDQPLRIGPRLLLGVASDDVDAQPEPELSSGAGREVADAVDLVSDQRRWLAPGQIAIGLPAATGRAASDDPPKWIWGVGSGGTRR